LAQHLFLFEDEVVRVRAGQQKIQERGNRILFAGGRRRLSVAAIEPRARLKASPSPGLAVGAVTTGGSFSNQPRSANPAQRL
jgi:hypothetical protein